jgi:hypothetical protein
MEFGLLISFVKMRSIGRELSNSLEISNPVKATRRWAIAGNESRPTVRREELLHHERQIFVQRGKQCGCSVFLKPTLKMRSIEKQCIELSNNLKRKAFLPKTELVKRGED